MIHGLRKKATNKLVFLFAEGTEKKIQPLIWRCSNNQRKFHFKYNKCRQEQDPEEI